ncbi:flagellar assembly protein FliH [Pokkaliibacter sp. MBI-7]|uniref:flagellar assembly protein FliH n=1 Tax=Pokkaliibacter sp. MBI-7 TaxID=3040600 RepID=UPI00244C18B3|nr:flagellar assembly protein FliH [Pokkaliibacter sp. MBI-7]MDH2431265.1 flagellar assembly protein FliH [Pokkaliibacter sp. MBI-7]
MSNVEQQPHRIPASTGKQYERWQLPEVSDGKEHLSLTEHGLTFKPEPVADPEPLQAQVLDIEPAEEEEFHVEPLTLEQVEAIRQEAWDEGYQEGKTLGHAEGVKKGLEEGRKQGQEAGHAEAYQAESQRIEQAEAQLLALVNAFAEPLKRQDSELIEGMAALVRKMVEAVLDHELSSSPAHIQQLVKRIMEELPDPSSGTALRAHPADLPSIQVLLQREGYDWRVEEDASLSPGGVIVRTPFSYVDAAIEPRVAHVLQGFAQQHRISAERLAKEAENEPLAEQDGNIDADDTAS